MNKVEARIRRAMDKTAQLPIAVRKNRAKRLRQEARKHWDKFFAAGQEAMMTSIEGEDNDHGE